MIQYDDSRLVFFLLFRVPQTIALRAGCFSLFSAALTAIVHILVQIDVLDSATLGDPFTNRVWRIFTLSIGVMIAFRLLQALNRFWESAGSIHQMNGEWFQAASLLFAFSRKAYQEGGEKAEKVKNFRETLVRLMSCMCAGALEELGFRSKNLDVINKDGGTHLSDEVMAFFVNVEKEGFNKELAMLHMVEVLITDAHMNGLLPIPPPIMTRPYQNLSRGLVNFLNAKKVSVTPFPFPFSQLIALALFVHTLLFPFRVHPLGDPAFVEFVVAFVPSFFLYSLNFTAEEIEKPFGDNENDLSMQSFQDDFNRSLLLLLNPKSDYLGSVAEDALDKLPEEIIDKTPSIARRKTVMAKKKTFHELRSRKSTHFGPLGTPGGGGGESHPVSGRANVLSVRWARFRRTFASSVGSRWNKSDDARTTPNSSTTSPSGQTEELTPGGRSHYTNMSNRSPDDFITLGGGWAPTGSQSVPTVSSNFTFSDPDAVEQDFDDFNGLRSEDWLSVAVDGTVRPPMSRSGTASLTEGGGSRSRELSVEALRSGSSGSQAEKFGGKSMPPVTV